VDMVWRADVDARDVLVGGEFCQSRVGFFEAERPCGGAAAFGGAKQATTSMNTEAAK